MKKRKVVLTVLISVGLLTGCLGRDSALNSESSRIYVTDEGTFQTATVEAYAEQDYYNADGLKSDLEEAVAAYNGDHGEGAVTLNSCSMEKGIAKMIFSYGSGEDLVSFSSQYEDKDNMVDSISISSLSDVLGQGKTEGIVFLNASDGKQAEEKTLNAKGENHAIIVETQTPVTIQTQGKLLFVSENVEIKDHYTVIAAPGKSYIIFK